MSARGITVESLLAEIKKGTFHPVYFLQGEEPYFIDLIVDAIESNALQESEKSFNQTFLYGRDTDMDTILNNARRFPMMAERQVVFVKEAQYLSDLNKEAGQKKLLDYISHVVPSTILVFCYIGKSLDGRKALAKQMGKQAVLFTSKKIYENQVPAWIDTYLSQRQSSITPKANALLTEYIGNNLERLSNELNKILINHSEKGIRVTEDEIETYVGINKDFNVFEFQNALLARNMKKIFQILQYFKANEKNNPPIATVAVTFNTLSKLLLTYTLKNPDKSSVAGLLKISPFFAGDYLRARMTYSYPQVVAGIDLLEQADAKLKGVNSGSMSHSQIMDEFILKFLH